MARRPKTGFDAWFAAQLTDRDFKRQFETARAEIASVDALVRALDARRALAGMTKAALAKRAGMKPELIRRLFSSSDPNPTLDTVVRLTTALDCTLGLAPRQNARPGKVAARKSGGHPTDRGVRARSSSPSARTPA